MLIASALLDELIAHAREEAPNECCGVIAVASGEQPRATRVHRAVNTAASPLRFEVDGREHHSHTRTAPYPSQTDINFAANWPGVEWIILGLAGTERPQARSYVITDGRVHDVPIAEPPA